MVTAAPISKRVEKPQNVPLSGSGMTTNSIFFCFLFVKNPSWQINDPLSGQHYSLQFLPATPLSLSGTLAGLFELKRCPSRALDLPRVLLPELLRNKDTVRCAAVGAEAQDTVGNIWREPWMCVCQKCTCSHQSLIVKSQQIRIELVTSPGVGQKKPNFWPESTCTDLETMRR